MVSACVEKASHRADVKKNNSAVPGVLMLSGHFPSLRQGNQSVRPQENSRRPQRGKLPAPPFQPALGGFAYLSEN